MVSPFSFERRVEFCETDAAGIAHFSSLILFMEQAEHALLRSLGLSVALSATSRKPGSDVVCFSWPRVKVECEFYSPARFEDVVINRVSVLSLSAKSVTFGHSLSIHERLVATGKMTSACCVQDAGKLSSVPIPEEVRSLLADYLR